MKIDELKHIIRENGVRRITSSGRGWLCISGCDLLGYIEDVEGFVSLLGGFKRRDFPHLDFVSNFINPINVFLNDSIEFCVYDIDLRFSCDIIISHNTYQVIVYRWCDDNK